MSGLRIALHGGAGVIDRDQLAGARERRYREALGDTLSAAHGRLRGGATAVDAVEHAVRLLEDCELFNAGFGSVLTRAGEVELDAAIMSGDGRRCGAVAAARRPRHPVSLARAVMERTEHVLLVGAGADALAAELGCELAEPAWFVTASRRAQLDAALRADRVALDHDLDRGPGHGHGREGDLGTVGAVARDDAGHLAAATSTGGMTNQRPGRVGDTPIIGAGTWADDATCAVSGTGHGEFFIRAAVAGDVHARMAYGGATLAAAAAAALATLARLGGSGGLIAVGSDGTLALPFNSPGMYRAWIDASGEPRVAIYEDDER